MGQSLHIGTAAKETGLSIDAIRFYQKSGLLKPPARTSGGYRVFTEAAIAQLGFIAGAQNLGFSLAEIKEWCLYGMRIVVPAQRSGASSVENCGASEKRLGH